MQDSILNQAIPSGGVMAKCRRYASSVPFLGLIVIIGLLLATIIPFLGYYPTYDGIQYTGCIINAVKKYPFNPLNFRCYDHPFGYTLLLGVTQYLDQGNVMLMYFVNLCISALSIVAVYKLMRLSLIEDSIVTPLFSAGIFGLMPLYVVHILQINLDFALASLFVIFLYFLLSKQRWKAVIFASILVLTKETGIAAYICTILVYLYFFVLLEKESARSKVVRLMDEWPLILPGIIMGGYIFLLLFLLPEGGKLFFHQGGLPPNLLIGLNFDNPSMRAFLAFIFVLNFNWILSGFILVFLFVCPLRWESILQRVKGKYIGFFFVLMLGITFIVTRLHQTFWIPRYVLMCYPILVVIFCLAIVPLFPKKPFRFAVLVSVLVLMYISNFRTIDPFSRKIFGTASVGTKIILSTALSQMNFLYNLEGTDVVYALRKMLEDVPIERDHIFFVVDAAAPPLAEAAKSLPSKAQFLRGTSRPEEITPAGLSAMGNPEYIDYVDTPNSLGRENYEYLKSHYRLVSLKQYKYNGYVLTLHSFVQ